MCLRLLRSHRLEPRIGANRSKLRGKLLVDGLKLSESLVKLRGELTIWEHTVDLPMLCLKRIDRSG